MKGPAATPPSCRSYVASAAGLLDASLNGILAGDLEESVWRLASGLRSVRAAASPEQWAAFAATCLAHPLSDVLHQEPYTRRGYSRPRGYPGDAALIDYLYLSGPQQGEEVTDLGLALHRVAVRTPAGYSVRFRRDFAAGCIDGTAARVSRAEVLSVGCGHLREAGRSHAVMRRRLGRFLAIDQDPESVRVVAADWGPHGVEARCVSAAELMSAGEAVGRFDLVYALGLYDYLETGAARMLTRHLFALLAPGGTLLVANFVPGGFEAGYMEAFMRWHLVYRTPEQLRSVCGLLPSGEVARTEVVLEDLGNVAYLAVVHA